VCQKQKLANISRGSSPNTRLNVLLLSGDGLLLSWNADKFYPRWMYTQSCCCSSCLFIPSVLHFVWVTMHVQVGLKGW
jgi:hypothetical protein